MCRPSSVHESYRQEPSISVQVRGGHPILCCGRSKPEALGISERIHTAQLPVMAAVVGTPVAVQQKLMRHADIRTTMNTYGYTFQPELVDAASKVAGLVLTGAPTERKPS